MHKLFCQLLLPFLFVFTIVHSGLTQNLFDINTIRTVEINFFDADWDYQLDSLAMLNAGTGSGTERVLASVVIDGIPFDSCGVRYKGNSSMDTAKVKNPFNIDLNYTIAGQDYFGKDKIKLANNFSDPSMVREALMYEISNQYMDCPQGSFVKLYINGTYIGLYTNTESIDNEYLNDYYGSSDNPFFKCDPISFQIFGDNSNLAYYADTMAYDTLYDMKSSYGYEELQTLCYNLEFNPSTIDQYLDVDRALWFLALSNAFVHNDGYTAFGHNYYLYKMDNGRWSIVLWDVNMSFGGLLWNGTNIFPLGLPELQNQDPFLHQAAVDFRPLIAKLLSIPAYRKAYTAHFRTIVEENISNGYYLQRAEFMQSIIDADAQIEPFNDYTYTEFTNNLYTDVGVWYGYRPGLENLMVARESYLTSLPEFQFLQPTISNITPSSTQPPAFSTVGFTATVSDANLVMFGYRHNQFDVFTKTQMFDDGLHNDGAAGDGVYGVDVSMMASTMQYYIYAQNANALKFSPVRAEYEFYSLTPLKGIVINEFDATASTAFDQNFEYEDWIELYNNSDSPINLTGYHLSDNVGNPYKWTFPNVTIGAGEYLIVWADIDTLQVGLHANFSLSSLGEELYLTDNFGILLDEVVFPAQTANVTYGRFVNGTGNFTFMYPTYNAQNTTPVGLEEENIVLFTVYPNPASANVTILFPEIVNTNVLIIDITGKVIINETLKNTDTYLFDVSSFEAGMYFVTTGKGKVKKLVVQ